MKSLSFLTSLLFAGMIGCYASGEQDISQGMPQGPGAATTSKPVATEGPGLELTPNPLDAAVTGKVQALADATSGVVLFGERGAMAIAGTAVATSSREVTDWRSAATVRAADGSGEWAVAVTADGRVMRLRDQARLENVGGRYGMKLSEKATSVLAMTDTSFAIVLESGLIAVDAAKGTTERFDSAGLMYTSATAGKVAGVEGELFVVLDLATKKRHPYPGKGVVATAFDAQGRALALTAHELWREAGEGLELVIKRDDVALHDLVRASSRVWLGSGTELWALEQNTLRKASSPLAPGERVVAARGDDVWTIADAGVKKLRVQISPEEQGWQATVWPVYDRACKECHASVNASSRIDLSTYAAWTARKAAIKQRVLVEKTMPPAPRTLSDADVAAIKAFVDP